MLSHTMIVKLSLHLFFKKCKKNQEKMDEPVKLEENGINGVSNSNNSDYHAILKWRRIKDSQGPSPKSASKFLIFQ